MNLKRMFYRHRALHDLISVVLLGMYVSTAPKAAELAVLTPSPAQDVVVKNHSLQKAIFAGGCFWGVQGIFQHVKGVHRAVAGYSGGSASQATYSAVSTGYTGHAESVEVIYDPGQVSYGRLLQIFFSVAHDPTQFNHQGFDVGTQYRSEVFAVNSDQFKVAKAYINQMNASKVFNKSIVTQLENNSHFFVAENYHQDYMTRNPNIPYIAINELPKLENLERLFPDSYRNKPVLVRP